MDKYAHIRSGFAGTSEPHVTEHGSLSELVAAVMAAPEACKRGSTDFGRWAGANSVDDFADQSTKGNAAWGKKASAMLERLEADGIFATGPQALGASVVGVSPLVPAYLAGHPEQMLGWVETRSPRSPLKIYVGLGGAADIGPEELVKRGTAIAALVLALAPIRSVEIYAATMVQSHSTNPFHFAVNIVPVNTKPLDVDQVAWVLGSPAMHRVAGFLLADAQASGRPGGARGLPYAGDTKLMVEALRIALQEEGTETLIIPRMGFQNDEIVNNPEKWVRSKLLEYGYAE